VSVQGTILTTEPSTLSKAAPQDLSRATYVKAMVTPLKKKCPMDFLVTSIASIQQGSFRIASQIFTRGGQEMKSGIEKTLINEKSKNTSKTNSKTRGDHNHGIKNVDYLKHKAKDKCYTCSEPGHFPENVPRRMLLHAPRHQK
jgi:hypothetical protein